MSEQKQKQKHTPEPWRINKHSETSVEIADGRTTATCGGYSNNTNPNVHLENAANAARIVSCINALAGIENPAAFVARAADLERLVELYRQNDDVLHRIWKEQQLKIESVANQDYGLAAAHHDNEIELESNERELVNQITELTERLGL